MTTMKQYESKKNGALALLVKQNEDGVLLQTEDNKTTQLALSTFKRWWKFTGEVTVAKNYYQHKPYKRNEAPLWDAVIDQDNRLAVRDSDKNIIMLCSFSNSFKCIRIRQMKYNSSRYFTKYDVALKHILNNQDIRTSVSITETFKKWVKRST